MVKKKKIAFFDANALIPQKVYLSPNKNGQTTCMAEIWTVL